MLIKFSMIRDHLFKTSAIVHDFWPLPPSVAILLLRLSVGKFGKSLTPIPLKMPTSYIDGSCQIWKQVFNVTKGTINKSTSWFSPTYVSSLPFINKLHNRTYLYIIINTIFPTWTVTIVIISNILSSDLGFPRWFFNNILCSTSGPTPSSFNNVLNVFVVKLLSRFPEKKNY